MLKIIISLFALTIIFLPQAFADNTLQNTSLIGEGAIIKLDIEFGEDTVKSGFERDYITNHLDAITLTFYGDKITLTEPEIKITSTGNNFRIHSVPEGILIYGHKYVNIDNYKINIYLSTDKGFSKYSVYTAAPIPDEIIIEPEPIPEKVVYVPDICMTSSHDFRTYWMQNFDINVQSFDCNVNSDPESSSDFYGRIDGVDVKVLISLDDNPVSTLSGITANNGHWDGQYYFPANISPPGEYDVDVILSYINQTITKTTAMFVINMVVGSDSTNHPPIANAGIDQTEPEHNGVNPSPPPDNILNVITLDGSASSDPDENTITYSWAQINGTDVILSDVTARQPTFTAPDLLDIDPPEAGPEDNVDLIFELTVTDSKG